MAGKRKKLQTLEHPTRRMMLQVMIKGAAGGPGYPETWRGGMCAKDLADYSGKQLSHVSYHMRCLRDAGMAMLVGEKPVRGTAARYYRPTVTERWIHAELGLDPPGTVQVVGSGDPHAQP